MMTGKNINIISIHFSNNNKKRKKKKNMDQEMDAEKETRVLQPVTQGAGC